MNMKLDQEEKEILDAFEAGEFESVLTPERKKMLEEAAEETFRQDMEIKVTISARDLTMLEKKALEDGLSSQAMITRILHKFASGTLYDLTANKDVRVKA